MTKVADNSGNSDTEWANATAAIKKLNGVVPYSLIRGNEPHDSKAQFDNLDDNDNYNPSGTATGWSKWVPLGAWLQRTTGKTSDVAVSNYAQATGAYETSTMAP